LRLATPVQLFSQTHKLFNMATKKAASAKQAKKTATKKAASAKAVNKPEQQNVTTQQAWENEKSIKCAVDESA
jgi:hypothetical protein